VYWVLLKRREERFSLSFALVGLNFNPTNQPTLGEVDGLGENRLISSVYWIQDIYDVLTL
jgi:hypothetical protein